MTLYHCMIDPSPATKTALDAVGAQRIGIIYQHLFLTNGHYNLAKLRSNMEQIIEEVLGVPFIVIDFEGPGYQALTSTKPDDINLDVMNVIFEFIAIISYVKAMFPGTPVGIFGLGHDHAKNHYLNLIVEYFCDMICPAIYIKDHQYPDSRSTLESRISMAKEIHERTGKPILPFVWERQKIIEGDVWTYEPLDNEQLDWMFALVSPFNPALWSHTKKQIALNRSDRIIPDASPEITAAHTAQFIAKARLSLPREVADGE